MNMQEISMQEYYENIVNKHSQDGKISNDTHKILISQFQSLNKSIQYKLEQYTKLISAYLLNVQDKFLLSFTKVLEKMGNDLMLAQQAYKNIDKQVMAQQKCTKLAQDKIFFINESNYYHQQLLFKSKQANQLKEKNYLLIKQNTGLKQKLFEKVKQNMIFKQKLKKLSKFNFHQQQSLQHSLKQQQQVNNQKPLQQSPQKKQQERLQLTDDERRWSSFGRQTKEQRRQKKEQKQRQKKNLLIDIRKQLQFRDRINLDEIVNRSVVEKLQVEQIQQMKKKKFFEKSQRQDSTMRLQQSQKRSRSIMSSTAGTSFPLSRTQQSFNQRRMSFNYMGKMVG